YLQVFHEWPQSQLPLYQMAHFLLKFDRDEQAAAAFRNHWEKFSVTLKEPIREESLRNLVSALDKVEEKNTNPGTTTTDNAENLYKYAQQYVEDYPDTQYNRPIAFLRSVTYFKYQRTEDGIRDSQRLFLSKPGDEYGSKAFKNLK